MSNAGDTRYEHFDRNLQEALRDFLEYEERNGGPHENPAVRAAQFNTFVARFHAHIRGEVTPDLCETYLKRFKYLTLPLDQEPEEPLDPQKRHAQACIAYGEFRSDVGFSGSREAEAMAFRTYVQAKYPKSLPDFTEEEAASAISVCRTKRTNTMLGVLFGIVCAIGLAGIFLSATKKEPEKPPSNPKPRKLQDGNDRIVPINPRGNPLWLPHEGDQPWQQRFLTPEEQRRMEKEWRDRFKDDGGLGGADKNNENKR